MTKRYEERVGRRLEALRWLGDRHAHLTQRVERLNGPLFAEESENFKALMRERGLDPATVSFPDAMKALPDATRRLREAAWRQSAGDTPQEELAEFERRFGGCDKVEQLVDLYDELANGVVSDRVLEARRLATAKTAVYDLLVEWDWVGPMPFNATLQAIGALVPILSGSLSGPMLIRNTEAIWEELRKLMNSDEVQKKRLDRLEGGPARIAELIVASLAGTTVMSVRKAAKASGV